MVGRVQPARRRGAGAALLDQRVLLRSKSQLYRGNAGVAAYFNALPRWSSPAVQFTDRTTAQVNSDVINFAATASFVVDESTAPLSVKITWVIAREDDGWKIVSHHVSSRTPLLGDDA
jgi:ketosteroid isomerase-like protein